MRGFQRGAPDLGTVDSFVSFKFGRIKLLSPARGPTNPDPLIVPKHVLGLVSSTLLSVFLILSVSVSPETWSRPAGGFPRGGF